WLLRLTGWSGERGRCAFLRLGRRVCAGWNNEVIVLTKELIDDLGELIRILVGGGQGRIGKVAEPDPGSDRRGSLRLLEKYLAASGDGEQGHPQRSQQRLVIGAADGVVSVCPCLARQQNFRSGARDQLRCLFGK